MSSHVISRHPPALTARAARRPRRVQGVRRPGRPRRRRPARPAGTTARPRRRERRRQVHAHACARRRRGPGRRLRRQAGRPRPTCGQEPDFPDGATVGDVLDAALAPLHDAVAGLEALASRLGEPGVDDEYDAMLTWATLHEAWDADRRAEHRRGPAGARHARPRPARRDDVRRSAQPAGPGRARHPSARVRAARRAHQPPRRRGDGLARGVRGLAARGRRRCQPRPGVPGRGLRRRRRSRPGAPRRRRHRRQPVHRRLHRVPRGQARRPPPVAGGVRGPAGRARRSAPLGEHDSTAGRAQPGTARRRQVHPPLQGPERRPHDQPTGEGRRAAHRGARARPGAQAAVAVHVPRGARTRTPYDRVGGDRPGPRGRRPAVGAALRRALRWPPAGHRRQRLGEVDSAQGARRPARADLRDRHRLRAAGRATSPRT